jgi:hypothetical protein
MIPKVETCIEALDRGVKGVVTHLTRRRPQSDAVASVEDFDDVRAEKTPPAVR